MCVEDHKPLFRQTGETNSETRFSLKFVNVGDEQKFPKTSVCIILVDLVYLESAKIYTGSKRVHGLKRLRTTVVEDGLIENSDIGLCELVFCRQYSRNSQYFHGLVSHLGTPELHQFLFCKLNSRFNAI